MQIQEALIAALVLGPILFGLLILTGVKGLARTGLIVLAALSTIGAGVALPVYTNLPNLVLPAVVTSLGSVLEPLMIVIILTIGYRLKSWPVSVMALVQLAFCGMGFVSGHHGETPQTLLVVDKLAMVMVLIVSVIGSLIVLFAVGYMKNHEHHAASTAASTNRFFFVLIAFLGLMNGLVLVDNMKWLAIFWEGTTLCSFFLIGHEGTTEAKASARRAITMNVLGGLAMSAGLFLSEHRFGAGNLSEVMAKGPVALLPIALLVLATMTKSAQMPFQSWLLGAMVAPTPVSALLHSSTMVKAGSYLVLRLSPAFNETPLALIVAIAGAFTFLLTSALAIGQSNGKKVLAYSTIANLGLIVCCAGIGTPLAIAAGVTILIFHAVSKALLFLCVGTIEQTIGSRDIEDMSGLLFKMPLTTNIAIIGMISMMMPPCGMLIGKWMAIEAAAYAAPVVVVPLVLGSALTIFFWAKWIGRITTSSYHPKYTIENIDGWMRGVLMVIGAGVVMVSVFAMPVYVLVIKPLALAACGVTASTANLSILDQVTPYLGWPMLVAIGAVILAVVAGAVLFKPSRIRLPYLCGENIASDETSFSFRSIADGPVVTRLSSYYPPFFGEAKITVWGNPVALLILISLFGVLFK